MQFGYTLSDDHDPDQSRASDDLIMDIVDEANYAEQLGYRSAWLGEDRSNAFVIVSGTELALAYVAARTKKIRLVPAVTISSLHHPIPVAEQWATLDLLSRGRVDFVAGGAFDRNQRVTVDANFEDNIFAESLDCLEQLWANTGPVTHRGKHYRFENRAITPQPVQRPIPINVASFSYPTIDLAARRGFGIVLATFAADTTLGGIGEAARYYKEACAKAGRKPGRLTARHSINFADTPADVVSRAGLLGPSAKITDALKAMEDYGFDEIVLDFHVGFKSRQMVKDEMARFMSEVAPHFRDGREAA